MIEALLLVWLATSATFALWLRQRDRLRRLREFEREVALLASSAATAAVGMAVLASAMSEAVRAAVVFQQAWDGVGRTLNSASSEVDRLREGFQGMGQGR